MVTPLQRSLNILAEFTPKSDLNQFTDNTVKKPPIRELKLHFLELNSSLAAFFAGDDPGEEDKEAIKKAIEEIHSKKRTAIVLDKLDNYSERNELSRIMEQFHFITKDHSRPPANLWQSRLYRPTLLFFDPPTSMSRSAPCEFNEGSQSLVKGVYGVELIKLIKSTDDKDLKSVAQSLDATQAGEIILANECKPKNLEILFWLRRETLFHFMIRIDDLQAIDLNNQLRKSSCNKEWLTERFKAIRRDVAFLCNVYNGKINKLNEELRDLPVNDITTKTIQNIDDLRHHVFLASEAQRKLTILITHVITDRETVRLFKKELPKCYLRLLRRLSRDEEEQNTVTGCPLGIIYRNVFGDNEDSECSESTDEVAPPIRPGSPDARIMLLEVITTWMTEWNEWVAIGILENPDEEKRQKWRDASLAWNEGMDNLRKMGITSIQDLKRLNIFNKHMLSDYIQRLKSEVAVDDQSHNPVKRIFKFAWSLI